MVNVVIKCNLIVSMFKWVQTKCNTRNAFPWKMKDIDPIDQERSNSDSINCHIHSVWVIWNDIESWLQESMKLESNFKLDVFNNVLDVIMIMLFQAFSDLLYIERTNDIENCRKIGSFIIRTGLVWHLNRGCNELMFPWKGSILILNQR